MNILKSICQIKRIVQIVTYDYCEFDVESILLAWEQELFE